MKKFIIIILILVIAGGGYIFFNSQKNNDLRAMYKTQPLKIGNVTKTVSANGTLNPITVINVGTQVSGTVRKLYVDFNDRVTKGQLLMELDGEVLIATEKQSAAMVNSAKASLDYARADYNRMQTLYKKEYVSKQEVDKALQVLKTAQASLQQAEAQNQKDKSNVGFTKIYSPVDGIVTNREVDVGQTVAASFQTPTLITIAENMSKMSIDTSFAEADIGDIKAGQSVNFTVDAFPNQTFKGIVKQIRLNPTTNSNVVTYNVRIDVDNPKEILLPGMTAYVNIAVIERKNVLLAPNAALRFKPHLDNANNQSVPNSNPLLGGASMRPPGGFGKPNNNKNKNNAKNNENLGEVKEQRGVLFTIAEDNKTIHGIPVILGITDNNFTQITNINKDINLSEKTQVITGENLLNNKSANNKSNVQMRML